VTATPDRPAHPGEAAIVAFMDRVAIRDALVAYLDAVQRHEWAAVEACFAPWATLDYGTPGVHDVTENIRLLRAGVDRFVARSTLVSMHVVVDVTGDVARSRGTAFTAHTTNADAAAPGRMSVVVYADTWARWSDGGWRVTDRVVHHQLKGWLDCDAAPPLTPSA
jgi:hypothetical protein